MNEYVAVFFTHSGAIKFNRRLISSNIECELMPVPRQLSSNCGIGAKFKLHNDIMDIVDDEIDKVFIIEGGEYRLVYSDDL